MYLESELTPKGDSKSAAAGEEVEKARAAESRRWVEGLLATEDQVLGDNEVAVVRHRAEARAGVRGAAVALVAARVKRRLEEERRDIFDMRGWRR